MNHFCNILICCVFLTLIACAGEGDADLASVQNEELNLKPQANAGSDQNIVTGSTFTLNGGLSSDEDGDSLFYDWVIISKPPTSLTVLVSPTSESPTFVADVDGDYLIKLSVSDGDLSADDTIMLTASATATNNAPVSNAGSDQNIVTGSTFTLNGGLSLDVDGDSLFYDWVIISKPPTSLTVLVSPTSESPTFVADVDGDYLIKLSVSDGDLSADDTITLTATTTATNNAPVAVAGLDQNVITGDQVNLSGENSRDVDNDNLTFSWVLNPPSGSSASLSSTAVMMPTFTTDVDGDYIASLTVNDGELSSEPDSVLIRSTTDLISNIDNFDGNGPLIGYTVNNESDLPGIARVNDRYRANLTDNTNDKTLHFNNNQGRLDAKEVSFPFEVIARNIGIGTQGDSQVAPTPDGSQFIFAGVQIHVTNLNSLNSSHIVVGHRGGTQFTIEGKHTRDGASTVDDAGSNVAPDGRVDLRILGNSDRSLTVYWQTPNTSGQADNWQLYQGYATGNGALPGLSPNYGESVYVGLITYAQGLSNLPFVGTCDSFEIIQ